MNVYLVPVNHMPDARIIRAMFAALVPVYDRVNEVISLGLHRRWREKAAALAGIREGQNVLDLCTGTGDMAHAALQRCGEKGLVAGLDFCGPMVEKAIEKYARDCSSRLFFLAGDACDLPFADGYFDCITITFGLRNIADRDAALGEAARVLRAGGVLMILEFTRPRGLLFSRIYQAYLGCLVPLIGGFLSGRGSAYRYLADSIAQFPGIEELAVMEERAGFRDLSCQSLMMGAVSVILSVKGSNGKG